MTSEKFPAGIFAEGNFRIESTKDEKILVTIYLSKADRDKLVLEKGKIPKRAIKNVIIEDVEQI